MGISLLSNNPVVVTGGAGFVGSHLVETLLEQGDTVRVFDQVPLSRARNLDATKNHPGFQYLEGDIRDSDALRTCIDGDVKTIFHLASTVGVERYIENPLDLIDIVVGGTRKLIEIARTHGTKVILASTSEIYGRNPVIPWSEDADRVLGPTSVDRWSYSSSKAVCEHMLYGVHRQCGLPFAITRFFNVYGPRQNPIYVISQSVFRALRGEPPLRYDDGRQTRCFTYIADAVQGMIEVGRAPAAEGGAFNLGSDIEISVGEAIQSVVRAVGDVEGWEEFDTASKYGDRYEDIQRRVPDVAKARDLLGWKATTALDDGVARTVEWARRNDWWLSEREPR